MKDNVTIARLIYRAHVKPEPPVIDLEYDTFANALELYAKTRMRELIDEGKLTLASESDAQEASANGPNPTLTLAPIDPYDGLKRKYIVLKSDTGEAVENSFVLRPDKDPAAVEALRAYAAATQNKTLAADIINWVGEENAPKPAAEEAPPEPEPADTHTHTHTHTHTAGANDGGGGKRDAFAGKGAQEKREILEHLQRFVDTYSGARRRIAKEANGALTYEELLAMSEKKPLPLAKWRIAEAAMRRIEGQDQ